MTSRLPSPGILVKAGGRLRGPGECKGGTQGDEGLLLRTEGGVLLLADSSLLWVSSKSDGRRSKPWEEAEGRSGWVDPGLSDP